MAHRRLITGGDVLVGDPLRGEVRRADVLIEDGTIVSIGTDLGTVDAERLDATGTWIIPGFVDTHRHLWQTTMRAVTANWNLNEYFWCIRNNHAGLHGAEDAYAGQFAGALDALSAGVTTTIDHCHIMNSPDHADEAVRGITDAGIRALWCYGFYHSPAEEPHFTSAEQRYADARRVRATHFSASDGLVRMGVALNELGLVPFGETRREFEVAGELGIPVTAHTQCLWNPNKIEDVKLFHRAGLLRQGDIHSHANTCTDEDFALLRDAGCSVSSTPDTELQMGVGIPIFRRATNVGVTAGMGNDIVSNNSGDFFSTMRVLMEFERGHVNQPILDEQGLPGLPPGAPLSTRQILHGATLAGARALGLESVCGSIEEGKAADLVLLGHDRVHMRPIIDPVDSIVIQATTRDIRHVMVAGQTRLDEGRLPADQDQRAVSLIDAAHERVAEKVNRRGGWKPEVPHGLWDELWPMMVANTESETVAAP
ncbi:cytosine/adenosine deaminase-related metal-dependent hydrolase [Tamaricihabitans halophyticus]|uniref:Cytosine/adenosine deaminase-related metal-dependent hydrolase n=1 Tax=Tamaricihabitans halophyticus TaxID=1262583 RepID=A0A4R2QYG8_9PSEU|nr:amidohydrolase family protein [Tamaricihabitans halophyticus]TCP55290.1 cytosine/adenosine deaminase-related metal-dependent hydrolase [Tamaricihabitans halophyticus]